ncbi:hypothetical protein BO82DRAFT_407287 [Aspergillus uvarum CBS 121591]|uniref:Uncharacterized protein n=1 Tax=Aspergillus uvarum CBS 121591 TaxID=1448315 RepID=A0A319BXX1_9EURO|nr:hypothetical protein BO82DRAFT_407287 [Aspergillus uvarum CBS 121591]PYH76250.1 hypothetical protein BO82DRAFT_407287 [Aspergillus uvarum CBS 121591]
MQFIREILFPAGIDRPLAAYNASACEALRANWEFPHTHYESSSSVMAGFYANQSCDPILSPSSRCIVGTYVQDAVRVRSAATSRRQSPSLLPTISGCSCATPAPPSQSAAAGPGPGLWEVNGTW